MADPKKPRRTNRKRATETEPELPHMPPPPPSMFPPAEIEPGVYMPVTKVRVAFTGLNDLLDTNADDLSFASKLRLFQQFELRGVGTVRRHAHVPDKDDGVIGAVTIQLGRMEIIVPEPKDNRRADDAAYWEVLYMSADIVGGGHAYVMPGPTRPPLGDGHTMTLQEIKSWRVERDLDEAFAAANKRMAEAAAQEQNRPI